MNTFKMMHTKILLPFVNLKRYHFQVMLLILLVFSCTDLPTDPNNVSNSSVSLNLKTTTWLTAGPEVYDTVGNSVEFIVALRYPQFISSTTLQIMALNGLVEFDTTLASISKTNDTIRFTKKIANAGYKKIVATAHRNDGSTKSDTAYMHIADRVSANHNVAPQWDISDTLKVDLNAGSAYSLNLHDTCYDAVGDVLGFTLISGGPASDTIINNVYSFISSRSDTGKVVARIIAKDQGNLSDTLIIKFTLRQDVVSDTTHPVISVKNMVNDSLTISSRSTIIELNCTAVSGIKKVEGFIDTNSCLVTKMNDSTYSIAVKDLVANQRTKVTIIVTDSATPAITTTKEIYLKYDPTMSDTTGPVIILQSPADSSSVSSSSVTVIVKCNDSNSIKLVTGMLGTKEFTFAVGIADSYSAIISGLTVGSNVLKITATDASVNANIATKTFTISYDPTRADNVGPVFTMISGPVSGSIIESPLVTIVDSVSDESGVDSVTWSLNNGVIKQLTPVTGKPGQYLLSETLPREGFDTLLITAVDKSTNKNHTAQIIILNYSILPKITTQPVSKLVCANDSVEFSVTATGTAPLSYQWRKGSSTFTNIEGASSPSYPVTATAAESGTILSCLVMNANRESVVSKLCTLTINTVSSKPTATATPTSVCLGDLSTLSATGTLGTGAIWKWYTSKTGTALTSTSVTLLTSTWYFVRGEGLCGNSAWDSILVSVKDGPSIQTPPASQSQVAGSLVTFSVAATGSSTLSYQWKKGGVNVTAGSGGTTNSYSIASVASEDAGNYICVVTDLCGRYITSTVASLNVIPKYIVMFNTLGGTPEPATQNIASGAKATNPAGLLVRRGYLFAGWYRDSTGISKWDFASATVTGPVTLFAKWVIKDADSNTYTEKKIGNQVWMCENLKTKKYRNGDTIPSDYMKYPENSESNKSKFGILYNWVDNEIAPDGWRIPTTEDFETLKSYLSLHGYGYAGIDTAIASSIASQSDWVGSSVVGTPGFYPSGNNRCGFNAFPAGYYSSFIGLDGFGTMCFFFTTSIYTNGGPSYPIYYVLSNSYDNLKYDLKTSGAFHMSIRLIRE